jgi:hypothetical protein
VRAATAEVFVAERGANAIRVLADTKGVAFEDCLLVLGVSGCGEDQTGGHNAAEEGVNIHGSKRDRFSGVPWIAQTAAVAVV